MALKLRKKWQGAGGHALVPCRAALLGCLLLTVSACASDPCAETLRTKAPPTILPCPDRKENMCEYLAAKGKDIEVHFAFSYELPADAISLEDPSVEERQQCVLDYFSKAELSPFLDDIDQSVRNRVSVISTYPKAVPLASRLEIVNYLELDCKGAKCEDCIAMTAQQCASTPMCTVVNAWPVDLVRGCIGARQPMGCIPLAHMDTGDLIFARDPQGMCWMVEDLYPMPRSFSLWTGDGTCGIPPIKNGLFPPQCGESPAP